VLYLTTDEGHSQAHDLFGSGKFRIYKSLHRDVATRKQDCHSHHVLLYYQQM
jgi:hypothetical protein